MRIGRLTGARVGVATVLCFCSLSVHAQFRLERVASGLNQPTYLTQAPGDPSNILYYVERVSMPVENNYSIQAFAKVNHMGRVMRYDTNTRVSTPVLSLYDRKVFQDDGLQSVAFHPDFATNGKMYVVSSQYTGTQSFGSNGTPGDQPIPTNLVEEYTVNVADPKSDTTTHTRTVLSYTNYAWNNHTINWAGFDPTATGDERNYLYISTGDGAFTRPYNSGGFDGRPSQNPASVRGKILRVDISGGDSYPGTAGENGNRNYLVPPTNPIPTYNALNPGTPIAGQGEVWVTGMRNAYRMSFDRANGDIWMGDVGENLYEEIDFLKAGSNSGVVNGPADFGWPQLEGVIASPVSGAPHTSTNPFTGATSINPIHVYDHTFGSAVIGGYVYRGEIEALQGTYFYADFAFGRVFSMEFDRDTPVGSFNAANGSVTEVTALLNSLVYDPTDPNYTPALAGAAFGLDKTVSFGEDNAGNVYLVDFGGTAGDLSFGNDTGEYPGAGRGEIFRFVPVLRGDANNSGMVDSTDFTIFTTNYGTTSGAAWTMGDFDGNGSVDTQDFNFLAGNFGLSSAPGLGSVVPEPLAVSAMFPAAWLLLNRRRPSCP